MVSAAQSADREANTTGNVACLVQARDDHVTRDNRIISKPYIETVLFGEIDRQMERSTVRQGYRETDRQADRTIVQRHIGGQTF